MRTAFDADALIYAATPGHAMGRRVSRIFNDVAPELAGVGSVLLANEVLPKPLHANLYSAEAQQLRRMLAQLELFPVEQSTSTLAVELAIKYGLKTVDAIHLATAIIADADRFLTNNRKDFPKTIAEVEIVYPDELAE